MELFQCGSEFFAEATPRSMVHNKPIVIDAPEVVLKFRLVENFDMGFVEEVIICKDNFVGESQSQEEGDQGYFFELHINWLPNSLQIISTS